MDFPVQYQTLNAALIPDTLLSADYNLFFSSLDPVSALSTLTDDTGLLYVGEQMVMDGRNVEILGSGTAQPGIQILSLVVPTGTAVDVVYMRDLDTGELILSYPDSPPNILSAIALVLTIDEVGYNMNTAAPVCFCKGTRIATPKGEVPVEKLEKGDVVLDYSGNPVVIEAATETHFDTPPPDWAPIVIEAGAFGDGLPKRRLKVSPQHRLCLPGTDPSSGEALLGPAKAFTKLKRVRQRQKPQPVTYHHLVTERHVLLRAEGVPAESMLLADHSLMNLPRTKVQRLANALRCSVPELSRHGAARPCGRILSTQDTRKMVDAWAVQVSLGVTRAWPEPRPPRLRLAQ
ncbi:Hint domain-containing protein [Tropicibacter naphthalenivorans]|uniref:Hedgehog/Intein (Hint) domain-containing protein n=1 Tax=Tropicibacter naphthalenivorans TaxID=441103 RepID=A0A0P1FZH3_9RHOB|nr:Hint domain-containing protein [Tropicibacter naphthalenivorans]CUH74746.1 hypothetical protein TRN7648_00062 [Tropicibacter naphthalenivorans]SMC49376.1 Hint domain-containing protein [Tropicibacter naphthalenivorans]